MIIDIVRGKVVDGIGTGFPGVIFTKMYGRREKVALTVILDPNAGLHLFSPARAGLGDASKKRGPTT